jgi:hypothetical protein
MLHYSQASASSPPFCLSILHVHVCVHAAIHVQARFNVDIGVDDLVPVFSQILLLWFFSDVRILFS